jgi:hypothetical protein
MKLHRIFGMVILPISIVASIGAADAQSPSAAIDVVGIKLGMPLPEAVAVVKTYNPKLGLQTQTLELEGFDKPFVTAIVARQPTESGKDSEEITLLVTTPPSNQVVWGIQRIYHFGPQTMVSLDNTVAGLRKKYGAENAYPLNTDTRVMTKGVAWAFDTSGKLMDSAQAKALYLACDAYLSGHFNPVALNNDLQGTPSPPQCNSVILANASIQAAQSAALGTTVVGNLIFQVTNGAVYRAAINATRDVAIAAARAREKKESQKVDQRGAPKL